MKQYLLHGLDTFFPRKIKTIIHVIFEQVHQILLLIEKNMSFIVILLVQKVCVKLVISNRKRLLQYLCFVFHLCTSFLHPGLDIRSPA